MDNKLTTEQFGASVRLKFPQYAKHSNKEIAQRVLARYPQYAEKINDLPEQRDDALLTKENRRYDPSRPGAQLKRVLSPRKIFDFFTSSTQKLGTSAGQSFAAGSTIEKLSESERMASDVELNLTKRINENKKLGKDTSRLERELTILKGRQSVDKQVADVVPVVNKSNKQILGEGLGTAVEALSGGIFKGVRGARFTRYIAPTAEAQKLKKAEFLAKPLKDRLKQIGGDVLKDAAVLTPVGYTIDISQRLQADKSGAEIFKPGLGTLISAAIPIGIGGIRAGRQVAGEALSKVVLPNLSGVQSKAYERLQTGGAQEFIGKTTPESVLNDARASASAFRKTMYDEFGQGKEAIITEFTGKRIGVDEKTGTTLRKVAERFGFEDRLPQNVSNMSAKETMDLLAEINKVKPVTDIDDPLVRSLKFALSEVKNEIMTRAKAGFGGKGGRFEKIYSSYAKKAEGLKNIQSIIGKVGVNIGSKKLNPIQKKTAINRLQAAFKENADGYIEAIKVIEDETGERILDKIAASQLSPILPKTLRTAPQGPGGVLNDIVAAITIPLSSPRIGAKILSIVGGYGEGVATRILNSSPAIRKAIHDAVTKENMSFNDAVELYAKEYIKNPRLGLSLEDVSKRGYKDTGPLTTKVLIRLEGRSAVSKQFISDLTNQPDLKQAEKDLIRDLLKEEGEMVNVKNFANKVKSELLPLQRANVGEAGDFGGLGHEGVTLPDDLRGPVANYNEHIYESPIGTSAGSVHYDSEIYPNYFAHTRIEDLPDEIIRKVKNFKDMEDTVKAGGKISYNNDAVISGKSSTRRVIEIQSDLFQKGRLENEMPIKDGEGIVVRGMKMTPEKATELYPNRVAEISKLEPYRNTWHERVIREEVKKAAQDGKTKLQFPTGETAMKIEGLGEAQRNFAFVKNGREAKLTPEELKVGLETSGNGGNWIITDVLGDGKFKAVPKSSFYDTRFGIKPEDIERLNNTASAETFDISGRVDTSNPIYKFYEKEVGRYLSNKYGAKRIKDAQGVEWWEVNVDKKMAKEPVLAFGKASVPTVLGGGAIASAAVGLDKADEALSENRKIEYQRAPDMTQENNEKIRSGILHVENRGAVESGKDVYKEVGQKTGDLGKYQVSPNSLADWSEIWLGKKYTPEEFLNDPDAQEKFFNEFLKVVNRLELTPEQSAVAWHRGWGELGMGPRETRDERFLKNLEREMGDSRNQSYLKFFGEGIAKL